MITSSPPLPAGFANERGSADYIFAAFDFEATADVFYRENFSPIVTIEKISEILEFEFNF